MAVETKEEETIEEKLAKSSGTDADKYAEDLEAQADNMLKEMYEPESKESEEEENEQEEEESDSKEASSEEEKKEIGSEDEEILVDGDDTVESLTEKLQKSEKRVKDNQSAFTKNQQTSKEDRIKSDAVVETLQSTIADLQQKVSQRPAQETKQEEKKAEEEIKESVSSLKDQFEALNKIDPDIAKPLEEIIGSLTTQISGLKTELKSKAENDQKTSQKTADDIHFGKIDTAHPDWEEINKSDEFETWINELSPRQRNNARQDLDSGSAENVIGLFDEYKESTGIAKTEETDETTKPTAKDDKLKKAKTMVNPNLKPSKEIKTSGGKIKYTREMIVRENAKDPNWYAKHEADIDIEIAARRVPDR